MSTLVDLPPPLRDPAEPAGSPPRLRLVPAASLDFDAAVRRITPRLQRYARRRLGDEHEAEELVQEALLRAYRNADQLQGDDDLMAWCTVVTGRLAIDRLRVRNRSTCVADVPEGPRASRDTAEVVVARDEARTALDALEAMPARQAAVLWAREVEGQSYDEIGRRFGMTEPAVRSILTRARSSLRKEYAARGGTLPVAGLSALAPWVRGLHWANRLRRAATRLAAPVTLGAVALGLLGTGLPGAVGSRPGDAARSGPVITSADLRPVPARPDRSPGTTAAAPSRPSRRAPGTTAAPAPRLTLAQSSGALAPCVSANGQGRVGRCVSGAGTGTRVWLARPLPTNPTGVHYVGVDASAADCRRVLTQPLLSCTPGGHR